MSQNKLRFNKNLIEYAAVGNINGVIESLKNKADVHANDDAAFRLSAENGYTGIVTVLLEHGANVHAKNDDALRQSVKHNNIKMLHKLLEYGANASVNNNEMLILCAANAKFKIVTLLLEHGADANTNVSANRFAWCRFNENVLSIVVKNYLRTVYPKIMKGNAFINATRGKNNGTTANNMGDDYLKVVAVLLEHGADVYVNNGFILKRICNNIDDDVDADDDDADAPEQPYKEFYKDLADVLLPYCQSDAYCYFPSSYIKENVVATKGSNKN